jgi:hypothetical protein
MKFLCLECDERMDFDDRQVPGDGTFGASYKCPSCGKGIAMLANQMETQLVEGLGIEIGGRTIDPAPMDFVQSTMITREDAFEEPANRKPAVQWTEASRNRLERVPNFVRGMVKRIYTDWAKEQGIEEMTPDIMDRARIDLGLEDM